MIIELMWLRVQYSNIEGCQRYGKPFINIIIVVKKN